MVTLTIEFPAMEYKQTTDEGDKVASSSIISGIEKLCQTPADRDVLLAVVIVNPFSRADSFAGQPRFIVVGVIDPWTASVLSTRIFREKPPFIPGNKLQTSIQQSYNVQR